MACSTCKRDVPIENKETGNCASCNRAERDDKGLYPIVREEYLKKMIQLEAKCPIKETDITMDSDIHHTRGRKGYADKWAYDNGITLLIDVRFFLAVSREGHIWIENNVEEAKAKGYSSDRLDTYFPNGRDDSSKES